MKKKLFLMLGMAMVGLALITFTIKSTQAFEKKDGVIYLKAQSTWIRGPGHQEWADYFTETLNHICKGRLIIDKMHADGELVGAFEAIPACSKGKLDIVSGSGYYLTGTLPWVSLIIGTAATRIRNADAYLIWQWEGGGMELLQQYVDTKYNMKVFPACTIPSEPLYSVKPVTKKEDFKGLKIRTTGLSMEFYKALGAAALTMPMSEVIPSLEKKVIDAAEFCVPYTDYPAHIHEIAPYALTGALHQPTSIGMEIWINGDTWKALPDDLKKNIEYAVKLTQYWFIHHIGYKNMVLWEKMIKEGLKVTKASPELQSWIDQIAEQLAEKYAAQDPWAKKIIDSQNSFIRRYKKFSDSFIWFR